MDYGYIKLHRSIRSHLIFSDSIYLKFWVFLLMEVNHSDNEIIIEGDKYVIKRGSTYTSLRLLSDNLKMSRSKCKRILDFLKSETMIETQKKHRGTIITVVSYDKFQSSETQSETLMKRKRP